MRIGRAALLALVMVCAGAWEARAQSCTAATTSVNFGTYNVFASSPTDSTATIALNCGGNAGPVRISIGRGSAPTFPSRRMSNGPDRLSFNLYRDAARTAIWGDGTQTSQVEIVASVPNGRPYLLTVYGRVPAGQDVSAGTYTESVIVTIDY